MKTLHMISFLLVIVGAVNWGFVGLLHFNVLSMIGLVGMTADAVNVIIGLSGIFLLLSHKDDCGICSGMMMGKTGKKKK